MPIKVTGPEGEEMEALTEDEIKAETEAAVQAATKEATEKVASLEAELAKMKEAGDNAGALRKKTEELDAAKTDAEKKADEALAAAKSAQEQAATLAKTRLDETKDEAINGLAGGDKELAKVIAHHFDNSVTGMPATSKQEIIDRAKAAASIAGVGRTSGVLSGAAVSGAGAGTPPPQSPLSPEAVAAAPLFGLSKEDTEKYGPKQ